MPSTWDVASGRDLRDAYLRQSPLSEFVPTVPAIYLWRRALRVPREALASSVEFSKWLNTNLQVPVAEVRDQRLSHFAVVDHLTIRGAGLTPTKRQQFRPLMATRKARGWLAKYLHDLRDLIPPLYCGETSNLAQRTREHLAGDTGFGQRLQGQDLDLSWSDLELAFLRLDRLQLQDADRAHDLRKLLELLTTALSVSGYVTRRG